MNSPSRNSGNTGAAGEQAAPAGLNEAQLELLRDKYVLWDRASREGNMELRDYNRRAAEALKALLSANSEAGLSRCWLIEWPATRQDVVRYWHATEGRVIDPNHATRFARREDAEAIRINQKLIGGSTSVEHMWVAT